MGLVALLIAAIAGIRTLRRGPSDHPGFSTGSRAMALALALLACPLIPVACREARANLNIDEMNALAAWFSLLVFAGGCAWLALGGRSAPRPRP